ncbi:hypothetical protein NBG4_230034 [Candidatus Sulfobium mesophilum]|uniref:Response regulatory domain-containing protein n=1 Tax=Candidatus Sulfobium mesophilum TaxID=2016548 RepID=A0A2U3QGF3_9BACT|nr:hypothetical protein NBG4_230034 [Candidatus Sulfobium mesophilum]
MNPSYNNDFRVLIVNDDPYMRSFLTAFCEVNNYDASFARTGKDALALIEQKGPYLLIIADFLIPHMHGVDFIMQVRGRWKNIPVIALSSSGETEKSLIEAGACLFLEKPINPYILEKEIESIRGAGEHGLPKHYPAGP